MSTTDSSNSRSAIINTIETPLKLYALIALIVDGSLIATALALDAGTDRTILIIGSIILLLAIIVFTGLKIMNKSPLPKEINAMWTSEDIPLTEEITNSWRGQWNAEWTYKYKKDEFRKYVDDQIFFEKIDMKTGEFEGYGISSYETKKRYILRGRISKRGICHLFYSSSPPYSLSGVSIIKMSPMGELSGWWLGVGRKGGDIAGEVQLKKGYPNDDFEIKAYPVD